MAAIVGTILVLLNPGPAAFPSAAGSPPVLLRVVGNYVVPFVVASAGAYLANRRYR